MIYDLNIFLDVKAYKSLYKTTNGKIREYMERVGRLSPSDRIRCRQDSDQKRGQKEPLSLCVRVF